MEAMEAMVAVMDKEATGRMEVATDNPMEDTDRPMEKEVAMDLPMDLAPLMDKLPTLPNPTLNPSLAILPNHKLHIHPSLPVTPHSLPATLRNLPATLRNLPATLHSQQATLLSLKVTLPSSHSPSHSLVLTNSHSNPTSRNHSPSLILTNRSHNSLTNRSPSPNHSSLTSHNSRSHSHNNPTSHSSSSSPILPQLGRPRPAFNTSYLIYRDNYSYE